MSKLYNKFMDQSLSKEDIIVWLKDQSLVKHLMDHGAIREQDLEHAAECMFNIYLWYWKDLPIGHFLTAVLKNDFIEACCRADSTNKMLLSMYALFLYNNVPIDFRRKARSLRE
ncbi:hypothetical protein DRH29_04570 [candidate division Kazan bacterium]|uniref:Uncharacterized protein n=1 Tax=candidate division Kazan bacterium TaxID=2202143 RepID=A0A420ZBR8_UNCK3|nr:MAG: hypothetical protein DRH29_04570 [candidate division Kazan bacterium]